MNHRTANRRGLLSLLILPLVLLPAVCPAQEPIQVDPSKFIQPLSPQESMASIQVPDGYHLEVVASEPMIQDPVMFAFDGNGAMYVCEWLTYMVDEHATGTYEPTSRVVKLVDTDGDGKMDQRTVFIDGVFLPRTLLPLQDRVLVDLSHSSSIWSYFDEDGDGKTYAEGIMVPLEATFDNVQMADVLYYIGRSWDGWKKPIPPELIGAVRKAVVDRKTPWTEQELVEMARGK